MGIDINEKEGNKMATQPRYKVIVEFHPDDMALLEKIMDQESCSKMDAIRLAIRHYAARYTTHSPD